MTDNFPENASRYAIYFCPRRETALARFGARWLGYDVESGRDLGPRRPDWKATLAEPARYGFHATLKAPFHLGLGADLGSLIEAVRRLAGGWRAHPALPLELRAIGNFLALVPSAPVPALQALAAACVLELDEFRAPMTDRDLARRRVDSLNPRQRAYLELYGYPYVLDEFRFHMTLSAALPEARRAELMAELGPLVNAALAGAPALLDLCIVEEAAPGASFRIIERISLLPPVV